MNKIREILKKVLYKVSPEYQVGYLNGFEAGIKVSIYTLKSTKQLTLDYIKKEKDLLKKHMNEGKDE